MNKMLLAMAWIYTFVSVVVVVYVGYLNSRDLDSLVHRAQVAADAGDMLDYVEEYKSNLEARGLTSGHFALLFKKPSNDYALHYRTINRIEERLNKVKALDIEDVAYQAAMDDIRDTLWALESTAVGTTWIQLHWLFWVAMLLWLPAWLLNDSIFGDWLSD